MSQGVESSLRATAYHSDHVAMSQGVESSLRATANQISWPGCHSVLALNFFTIWNWFGHHTLTALGIPSNSLCPKIPIVEREQTGVRANGHNLVSVNFKMILKTNASKLILVYLQWLPKEPREKARNGQGDGLSLTRHQAISWTSDGEVHNPIWHQEFKVMVCHWQGTRPLAEPVKARSTTLYDIRSSR